MFSVSNLVLFPLLVSSGVHAATRYFTIDVTWESKAPDGYTRQQIVMNGTSPGPALIVDQYDDVEVMRAHMGHMCWG